MASERASQPDSFSFFTTSALLFVTSAALTIRWCASMSSTGMPMPGGWSMSMTWMRMPGQTWLTAAVSFLEMWIVMMMAMMLPSLLPMLRRYRLGVARIRATHLTRLTVLAGAGYFLVWTGFGILTFASGAVVTALEMEDPELARFAPMAVAMVVLISGLFQFTARKARHLACCRNGAWGSHPMATDAATAWRHGLHLGVICVRCCANLMAILLVVGIMDLRAMACVTAAITVERLSPAGEQLARVMGAILVVAGILLTGQAAQLR